MPISDLCYIDSAGLHLPDYPTVLQYMQNEYRAIFGADTYLEEDSQDGQWVAINALAAFELMQLAAAVYSSTSPATASGDALSRNVKLNGIARLVPSHSTVDLRIVGQAGTVIRNGQVEDATGQKWNLPDVVTIPPDGEITVTATADEVGALRAPAGSITKIATPTLGWQTVENLAAAAEGRPVETDAELRQRQTISTMIPARSAMEAIVGAVANIENVTKCVGYENDTPETDDNGLPAHSFCVVAQGGDAQEIADTIARLKTIGAGTFGNTTVATYDRYGQKADTKFSRPTEVPIACEVSLTALRGYSTDVAAAIKAAVSAHINALNIGNSVLLTRLYTPANAAGAAAVDITAIKLSRDGAALSEASVTIAYDELASCTPDDVTVIAT